jgi:hypothetical protein
MRIRLNRANEDLLDGELFHASPPPFLLLASACMFSHFHAIGIPRSAIIIL